jgi:AraC-like DNA-binding protein
MFGNGGNTVWSLAEFPRPHRARGFSGRLPGSDLKLSGKPGWSSAGGPARSHPARANPTLVELDLSAGPGSLSRAVLVGVFARWASAKHESSGALGAAIQFGEEEKGYRLDLLNGRHYSDAFDLEPFQKLNGDGTSLHTLGTVELDGETCRVDALSVDIPLEVEPRVIRFRDLGSPAVFTLFDVALEWTPAAGCPFHGGHGGVALSELGSVIRLRDRVRFRKAVEMLQSSLQSAEDLDEARGEALTFIAVATAATLELGAPRSMHRLQLEAARRLEQAHSVEAVSSESLELIETAIGPHFEQGDSPNDRLVDRALAVVERQFARPLTDAAVAGQLGLSPSHFRFLFRQATGQPFHKYLVAMRLERARKLLSEGTMPVTEVAAAVGFRGLSHFSRAFSQRFNVSPTEVRNSAR